MAYFDCDLSEYICYISEYTLLDNTEDTWKK